MCGDPGCRGHADKHLLLRFRMQDEGGWRCRESGMRKSTVRQVGGLGRGPECTALTPCTRPTICSSSSLNRRIKCPRSCDSK